MAAVRIRHGALTRSAARAAAALPHGVAPRCRQPRRVSARDRLRPPLLLHELRQVHGDQHEDGQACVEVPLASLRRRLARDRDAATRHGVRRLPEQAAVQRDEGRRQGDRVLRGFREDPLAEEILKGQFHEGEPDWIFNETECNSFGFPFAGFRLCLKNISYNSYLNSSYFLYRSRK